MEGRDGMKYATLGFVLVEIAFSLLLIPKKGTLTKPIHFIAITFFSLLMIYAIGTLLPIMGEGVDVVLKHMNTDAFRF